MMKIIFATGNKDKLREIREIMGDMDVDVRSMREAGIDVDIREDGSSFQENALIKAKTVASALPEADRDAVVLADDSGLEIDALGGEPGIYSARYMGEDTSYTVKNQALLDRLVGVNGEDRSARFVCAVAAVFPNGEAEVTRQTMEGRIGDAAQGENGFGYDPIFVPEGFDCSSAELSPEEKNRISHRGKALRAMRDILREHR